jgi:RNA polymerase sigma-70 factor (ECF subfamily)
MNVLTQVLSRERGSLSDRDRPRKLKAEFENLAIPQLNRLYAAAFYFTKDKTEAEDLVQETYLRAFSFFDHFTPGTNCRAWLISIMRNLFINRYRQKQREPEQIDWEIIDQTYETMIAGGEKSDRHDPETMVVSKLTGDEISKALQELPEEFRTAIVLVDVEDLTYEETAKIMGCPVGTVRSRVSRGRRLLQVALREYAVERGLIKDSTQRTISEKV